MPSNENRKTIKIVEHGPWGFFHFLAYVGAAIYFISHTNGGFWEVVLALLKAIVWPVYVIFHVLRLIGA
jgi:hypothetical protein